MSPSSFDVHVTLHRERAIYDAIVISDDSIRESVDVYAWVCDQCKYTSRIV